MQKTKLNRLLIIVIMMFCLLSPWGTQRALSQTTADQQTLTRLLEDAGRKLQYNDLDSASAAIPAFEAYINVLNNSSTCHVAEQTCDPWNVLFSLSTIYTSLNDDREMAFVSVIRNYYKKSQRFKEYFYTMVSAFQFFQMRQDKEYIAQIADELHTEALRAGEKSLVLSACKYMKAWAAMAQGLQYEATKWMEEAHDVGKPVVQEEGNTPALLLYIELLGNLAQGYGLRGNFSKAIEVLDEMDPMAVKQYGELSPQCLAMLMTKAEILYRLMRGPEMKAVLSRIEQICNNATNIPPQMLAQAKSGLAGLQSLADNEQSVESEGQEGVPLDDMQKLEMVVTDAMQSGQKDMAIDALQRLIALSESSIPLDIPRYSNYVTQQVNTHLSSHEYDKALECIQKAESFIETHAGQDPYATRSLEATHGLVLGIIADYHGALQHLNKAKYMYDCAGDHSFAYYQNCIGNLMEVCNMSGDLAYAKLYLDETEQFFQQNLLTDSTNNSPEFLAFKMALANMYVTLGYEGKVTDELDDLFTNHSELFTAPQWDYVKIIQFMTLGKKGQWEKAERTILSVNGSQDYNVMQKKVMGLLLCQASLRKPEVTATLDSFSKTIHDNVKAVMNTFSPLERQIFWENQAYYAAYGNNIVLHFLPENALVAERCYDNALYVKSMQDKQLHDCPRWQDISTTLSKNEVAIEFVIVPENFNDQTNMHYGALVLRHLQAPQFIDLCPATAIDALFQDIIHTDTVFINRLYAPTDNTLYKALWQPLEKILRPGDRIYFSPIGHLSRINIGAVCTADGSRIADHYTLHQVSTTGGIYTLKQQTWSVPRQAAVYGGIRYYESADDMAKASQPYQKSVDDNNLVAQRSLYAASRGALQDELAGTLEEALYIKEVMEQEGRCHVQLFTEEKGNEESVKAMNGSATELIHFGTHGFMLSTNQDQLQHWAIFGKTDFNRNTQQAQMLLSGLLMAGAYRAWYNEPVPEGVEDGVLTSYEVSKLDLRQCRLAVLSACETGLGFPTFSTGDIGMTRALKLAGAGTVMVSLWEVDDETTALLMQQFYQQLAKGLSPAKALEQAKDTIRQQHPQPYYWAPFVLIDASK